MADDLASKLHATTDAQVWANKFVEIFRGEIVGAEAGGRLDVGTMIGWFANAIEVGRDAGMRAHERAAAFDRVERETTLAPDTHYDQDQINDMDRELRAEAEAIRDAHDPAKQADNPYQRCALCHYTRHPCEAYEMADAVIKLLDR